MKPILPRLTGPRDLSELDGEQLVRLCDELREEIVGTVSRTGGHLGASLGVVELTVALHRVFESPRDKIVWDVGHQAYVHKLLTGRREQFGTLRRKGGIAGFPKREESEHDMFGVGHASTAVSAALGYARARDALREKHHVIAVVGDGALTGGIAFEGLNNAGQAGTDLIVVLNDNRMSISPNVGAISRYLTLITSDRYYRRFEADLWNLIGLVPHGSKAQSLASRIKEGLKNLIVPTILFENLGFQYYGPIDGHDLPTVLRTLESVRKIKGPVLVHTVTEKGKGYPFAEADDQRYHGVGKFDKAEGIKVVTAGGPPSYTKVFGETLAELARSDERIHGITAAMPSGTGIETLQKASPDRTYDVGIAEQHAVTFAAGLACRGLKPVVAIYSTFLQRAIDQIIHDVALQNLPVVFAVDRAGVVGEDGPTHHGVFDLTFLRMIPGMVVMAPKDEDELRHMLATALARDEGPSVVRYPRGAGLGVPLAGAPTPLPIGRAEPLCAGEDLCILAVGSMVEPAVRAAERLTRLGIAAQVVNMRFVKPLDTALLTEVWQRHRLVFTVEEGALTGGFGAAVLEWAADRGENGETQVIRLGIPDTFQDQASRSELLESVGLTAEGIASRAHAEWQGRGGRADTRTAS